MGELKDRVSKDIIAAMKAKEKIRLNALRYLKKLFIENDTSKKPQDELDIVIAHAKKMKDSLSNFPADSQMHQDTLAELSVYDEFLPQQLTEDDVAKIISSIVSSLDAPNMGAVMKELSPQIKGQFDGRKASQMVQDALKS